MSLTSKLAITDVDLKDKRVLIRVSELDSLDSSMALNQTLRASTQCH
jgi:hypothetical protein